MAGTSTLMALKATTASRDYENEQRDARSRDALVIVRDYLLTNGYVNTATSLKTEGGKTLGRFESADNLDLFTIMHEFEEYYEMKYSKKPKFTRRSADFDEDDDDARFARSNLNASKQGSAARRRSEIDLQKRKDAREKQKNRAGYGVTSGVLGTLEKKLGVDGTSTNPAAAANNNHNHNNSDITNSSPLVPASDPFQIGGSAMNLQPQPPPARVSPPNQEPEEPVMVRRLLKPLPTFGGDMELRALGETIQRDILQTSPDVSFDDIVELDDAKRLLKEAVVMPLKYPQLFTGLLSPWCGILLYGPPGTGKTMLAKAVASECDTTFFNISASSIVSKYRGDSEKLIRVLFELARYHAPSTVFMDEIDAIMSTRGGGGDGGSGEHEGSRRMKTELLIQMDGLASGKEHVFVLAASNLPWDLDSALLRRLEKRVFVPLPGERARLKMIEGHLGGQVCEEGLGVEEVAGERTEGFSGADIKLLCKEAAMRPVRRLLVLLEKMEREEDEGGGKRVGGVGGEVVDENKVKRLIEENPITSADLEESSKCVNKSSGGGILDGKYESWSKEFGST
jgi:katanin p60 ATPase-containing subunit A1